MPTYLTTYPSDAGLRSARKKLARRSPGYGGVQPVLPKPPPVDPFAPQTYDQIEAMARKRAQAILEAEQAGIRTSQGAYDTQAEQRRQAYVQLSQAGAAYLAQLLPQGQAVFNKGAEELKSIAAPLSEGIRQNIEQGELGNRAFVESQTPGAAPSQGPDAGALKDVLYGGGAEIPGASLIEQGQNFGQWAAKQPGIEISSGTEELRALDAEINAKDEEYRQQLQDVVSKYPELYDSAIEALQKWETEKATYKLQLRDQKLRERAESISERQLGIKTTESKQRLSQSERRLRLQEKGLRIREKAQIQDAQDALTQGRRIDSAASKTVGYLIDRNGEPILDKSGNTIGVYEKPSTKDTAKNYRSAVKEARDLRPQPMENPDVGGVTPGRYIARKGAKGKDVTPGQGGFPATTDNPAKASRDPNSMNFQQALNYLVDAYGITRTQARRALIASGWKPGR